MCFTSCLCRSRSYFSPIYLVFVYCDVCVCVGVYRCSYVQLKCIFTVNFVNHFRAKHEGKGKKCKKVVSEMCFLVYFYVSRNRVTSNKNILGFVGTKTKYFLSTKIIYFSSVTKKDHAKNYVRSMFSKKKARKNDHLNYHRRHVLAKFPALRSSF